MANYVPRLKKVYKDTIAPALMKEFNYTTPMQVPAVKKVVGSMGVGESLTNKKLLDAAVTDLTQITGQKAVKTKAKKSIANFKLREGNEIGAMVTLRGTIMYEFLEIGNLDNKALEVKNEGIDIIKIPYYFNSFHNSNVYFKIDEVKLFDKVNSELLDK